MDVVEHVDHLGIISVQLDTMICIFLLSMIYYAAEYFSNRLERNRSSTTESKK